MFKKIFYFYYDWFKNLKKDSKILWLLIFVKTIIILTVLLIFFPSFLWQELGWVVAEVGRQPWTVQNMLPTKMSSSHLSVWSVKFTFFLFLAIFTALIIAEFKIMILAIKKGPKVDEK